MPIKNRLKELRHDFRMNQKEFAEYIGVRPNLYNRWERQNGQPTLESVLRIAKRIGRPVEEIVYLDGEENSEDRQFSS